ncbi:hypothetical protein DPMN_012863 [Dreissena polymorpha]|uniref:Uncharacterized protein n=1 Tax=Dreissena polymorpha TaxID=45954 RepID=A0A9D4S1B6_DREPO|nr:hypothetical protein DPMN_012863 [Dreissena polymorpha]
MKKDQNDKTWTPATVVEKHDKPRSYIVESDTGQKYRRNRRHLKPTKATFKNSFVEDNDSAMLTEEPLVVDPPASVVQSAPTSTTIRSGRIVKVPSKYSDYKVDI